MSKTTKADASAKAAAKSDDPEALRRDIAEKRRELGDTAAELAAKADVKSQVKERVEERKEAVRDVSQRAQEKAAAQVRHPDRRLTGIVGAIAAALLLLALLRRRR